MAYDDGLSMAQMPDRCQGCPGQHLCYDLGVDCGEHPPYVVDAMEYLGAVL